MILFQFATSVRHQQGGVREDRVCARRAAQRWVGCMPSCVLLHRGGWFILVCVSSRPVSWPVLSLRGGGAEWWLLVAGGKLREKLWRLLMECGRQGCYLSRYCRSRSTSSYHPILNDPPHVQVITPVLKALVCLISYFCFFNLFFPLYLCKVKYTPKNIDDCINHWCYIIYYRCTWHLSFFFFGIFYHINPVLCFCPYLTVHASKSS